jgi:MSHA biogenesis protein MshO
VLTFKRKCSHCGFTLIELITVMVILSIVAVMGSQFLVSSIDSYRSNQITFRLVSKGRVAIEQMTRYLRGAVPNSIRVSNSGNCIEFMPAVAGGNYLRDVADSNNGASLTSTIATAPILSGLDAADHVVIGALGSSDIYSIALPSARTDVGVLAASPYTSISLAGGHRFIRNSSRKRLFLAADPIRFCLVGADLVIYEDYGLITAALGDSNPGGVTSDLSSNVQSTEAFSLSEGSEDRSSVISIALVFSEGTYQVSLNQQVFIRNVP